ncbi:MAG: PHP domain-containing protein [Gammaproteobacteria bacterium]
MIHDLHCHSTASDGTLSPTELVRHAIGQGVDVLALTDHDSTCGLEEARAAAGEELRLLNGIEISVTWGGRTVHIVGLGLDPDHAPLREGLVGIRETRETRAIRMAEKVEKLGVDDALNKARALAPGGLIARTHFARLLAQEGLAEDYGTAIRKYLLNGKKAFVSGHWADLEQAVGWITGAGGVAVIAHPARYNLTATKLRALVGAFRECGGQAMEVVSGSHSAQDVINMAVHVRNNGLHASCGSDYHGPENPWVELGRLRPLPADLPPVWDLLPAA